MIDGPATSATWTARLRAVVDSGGGEDAMGAMIDACRLAALVDDSRPPEWWREAAIEIGTGLGVSWIGDRPLPDWVVQFCWQTGVLADFAKGLIDKGLLAVDAAHSPNL